MNGKSSRTRNIYISLIITECECFSLKNPGIVNKKIKKRTPVICSRCGVETFTIPVMVEQVPYYISRTKLNKMSTTNRLKLLNQKQLRVLVDDDWWERYQEMCLPKRERRKALKERYSNDGTEG